MKLLKKRCFVLIFISLFSTYLLGQTTKLSTPKWALQGNVYEVNIRQYTKEGSFNAFAKHLDRLKQMGVQTLWFMPINPISKTDRKGTLGSYYAVSDYTAINPEYGNLSDWNNLVKLAHLKGFKVIIDWVPNHTGADHPWLTTHPDFYVQDNNGKAVSQFDWTDTRKLNYKNPAVVDSMIAAMMYWVKESGIDGFRCDQAHLVDSNFWYKALPILKSKKNLLMIAESEDAWVHRAGFDISYPWKAFHIMVDIANGAKNALSLDSVQYLIDTSFTATASLLYFTSNHDENSWNKADYGTMPGKVHEPFAVLSQTLPRSIPMIYSGQEEPILRAIPFFEKDNMQMSQFKRAHFYSKLLTLRNNNPALASNVKMIKVNTGNDRNVYAFYRKNGANWVFVITNLSDAVQRIDISPKSISNLQKTTINELISNKILKSIPTGNLIMQPWESKIYY
jgi:glycosidase